MEIISKKEAKLKGLRFYFTGKPCVNGHTCERYTSSGCVICSKDQQKKNPGNRKATLKKYNSKNYKNQRDWAIAHPEEKRSYSLKYYYKNKGTEKAKNRAWKYKGRPIPTRPEPEFCENTACRKTETAKDRTGKTKPLSNDHCHATGKFRGWLCNSCNYAAGRSADSVSILRGLSNYLEDFHGEFLLCY